MKWYHNLKIKNKLIIGFLFIAAVSTAIGVVGLVNLNRINDASSELYQKNALGLQYSGIASSMYQRARYNAVKLTLVDSADADSTIEKINSYSKQMKDALTQYLATDPAAEQRALVTKIDEEWSQYDAYMKQVIDLVKNNQPKEAQQIVLVTASKISDNIRDNLISITDMDAAQAKEKADNNQKLQEKAYIILVISMALGIIISITLALLISRIISNPIVSIVKIADQLALGNVTSNISIHTKDEIGNLEAAFQRMIENIRSQAQAAERIADGDMTVAVNVRSENDLLGQKLSQMVQNNNIVLKTIANAADQVASGAKQISETSMNLSQGATEQASAVEELTASLQQISSQTEVNAHNASRANDMSKNAKQYAVQGNSQMKEMLQAITDIDQSSVNISKIIKVIDDIAFQTNILALNAAVEAARAGQHGKGFAVVAEEVRNLAVRSASASKETTEMIENSMKKSKDGTRIAQGTAEALNKIVIEVENAANLVNDIATASNEQALGISQINQGIMQVSQVVQTNSATSQESAAASEELRSQAELLKEEVDKFKLVKDRNQNYRETISPDVLALLGNPKY